MKDVIDQIQEIDMEYLKTQLRSMLVNQVAVIGGQNVTCCVGERFRINSAPEEFGLAATIAEIVEINEYNRDADEFESALASMHN